MRSHHTGAAGTRTVDLGGGVEQTLVCHLLPRHGGSDGRREVDVALVWLVHLGLVGEKDLWLGAAEEEKRSQIKETTRAA